MIYHYMFYMYTCKHHSQVFISSSSFQRSSILRPCVRPKSINTFEGPNYRVTYSLFMCPYTSFISSLVSWPISKKNISNFSLVYTFGGSLCHSQEATNEILTHGIFHDMKFKRLYYKAYTFPKVIWSHFVIRQSTARKRKHKINVQIIYDNKFLHFVWQR